LKTLLACELNSWAENMIIACLENVMSCAGWTKDNFNRGKSKPSKLYEADCDTYKTVLCQYDERHRLLLAPSCYVLHGCNMPGYHLLACWSSLQFHLGMPHCSWQIM
jgi:hypothetical protein